MSQNFGGDEISYCSPLILWKRPRKTGTHRWSSQDSWVLFRGIASEEVTIRLVSPAHWYIMTISDTH